MTPKGNPGPILVFEEPFWTQQGGSGLTREYEGTREAIVGLFNSARALPNATDVTIRRAQGPKYILSVKLGNLEGLEAEQPEIRVTVRTEILDKDIWSHPTVISGMSALTSAQKVDFKQSVQKAVDEGDFQDIAADWSAEPYYSLAISIVEELNRGATHYADETTVCGVTRVISPFYSQAMTVYSAKYVYSTAQLPVPDGFAVELPDNTDITQVSGASWGWRLRTQESEWTIGKLTQTFEFVLAAWSTFLYTAAPSGDFSFT